MNGADYILGVVTGLVVGFAAGAGIASYVRSKKNKKVVYSLAQDKVNATSELEDVKLKNEQLEQTLDDITSSIAEKASPEEDEPNREPYVITEEAFQFLYPQSQEMNLTYIQKSGILLDEGGNVVFNIPELLGEEGEWALENTTEDVIYIHSDALAMNFAVEIDSEGLYDFGDEDDDLDD